MVQRPTETFFNDMIFVGFGYDEMMVVKEGGGMRDCDGYRMVKKIENRRGRIREKNTSARRKVVI